ncbi:MAG: hypothetical protein M0011_03845 [Elusimicrobia bacterium]|nr:hypothetical protein [Elusimicrobiota bacterium]
MKKILAVLILVSAAGAARAGDLERAAVAMNGLELERAEEIKVPEPAAIERLACLDKVLDDAGPLFSGTALKDAAAGPANPFVELKRLFDTGAQPSESDLTGMFEGRSFMMGLGKPLIMRAAFVGQRQPLPNPYADGGPLFNVNGPAVFQIGEERLVVDYCSTRVSLNPAKFSNGSAAAESFGLDWETGVMSVRMNSGYIITRIVPGDNRGEIYSYYFAPVKCRN